MPGAQNLRQHWGGGNKGRIETISAPVNFENCVQEARRVCPPTATHSTHVHTSRAHTHTHLTDEKDTDTDTLPNEGGAEGPFPIKS